MNLKVKIWIQDGPKEKGKLVLETFEDVTGDTLLREALREHNERRVQKRLRPIAFLESCDEGVCGACGVMINGRLDVTYGKKFCLIRLKDVIPKKGILTLKPLWGFPVQRDLVVDRKKLEMIISSFAVLTVLGNAPSSRGVIGDPKDIPFAQMASNCILCGRCMSGCPEESGMLPFSAAYVRMVEGSPGIDHGEILDEGVKTLKELGLDRCRNHQVCVGICPQGLSIKLIQLMRQAILRRSLTPK